MTKKLASLLTLGALLSAPLLAQATTYTFNASLAGSKEVPVGSGALATGTAILDYNDQGTASLADDTYNFSMSVFGLTGGPNGTAASAFHIHGAATVTQNGPVRVGLDSAPFIALNSGSTLLVGGNGVAAPTTLFVTGASATNPGYAAMSFLDMLRGGLTYVNVHTTANPGGAVRGQLVEVSAVPEPSTYAMWLAGLGVVGLLFRRKRQMLG
jgi:hypothetical protein